ncbi:cytochrome P450 [Geopyxis carbonaria]|nr:cytochrome P450 [Geopyxis carbonaria]
MGEARQRSRKGRFLSGPARARARGCPCPFRRGRCTRALRRTTSSEGLCGQAWRPRVSCARTSALKAGDARCGFFATRQKLSRTAAAKVQVAAAVTAAAAPHCRPAVQHPPYPGHFSPHTFPPAPCLPPPPPATRRHTLPRPSAATPPHTPPHRPTTPHYTMLALPFLAASAAFLLFYSLARPVFWYLYDPKGLRRYANAHPISGITNLWYMAIASRGNRSKNLLELHKARGERAYRVGPNHVTFPDLAAIKDIYGHGSTLRKGEVYTETAGTHRHLADVEDKGDHSRKRRMMANAYSAKNVATWEHKIVDKVVRMLRQFDERATPAGPVTPASLTVDYFQWINLFTLDAIADIGLSDRLNLVQNGDDLIDGITTSGKTYQARLRDSLHLNAANQSYLVWAEGGWYKFLKKLTRRLPSHKAGWDGGDAWDGLIQVLARRRLARQEAGEPLDDFFSSMWEDKHRSPNNLEWGEIFAECSIMMNAGSDTTAIAMTHTIYALLKTPRALATLRAEIATVLTDEDIIAPHDKVKHLPYLRACIDEALRLYPPVCFPLPRRTPPEGAAVLGEFLPGNTQVSVPTYVAHRDPVMFGPDPEVYRPERWLGQNGKDLQQYFLPFSAGARGCIGRNITYLEQYIVLATVLHRYELKLPSEGWEMGQYEGFNLLPEKLPLKVEIREGAAPLQKALDMLTY